MTSGATLSWRRVRALLLGAVCALAAWAGALAQDAATLRATHEALREQLASNQFQRPLHLESTQTAGDLKGDVHALIDQPFATVGPALQGMSHWCDILMLHLNVKNCLATSPGGNDTLALSIGRKYDQPLDDAYLVEFRYKVQASTADYLRVVLNAENGPLGTNNYRIVLEVVALDARRSFLHMSYSYAYGMAARMAMQGYLATIGRDKVGFSIIDRQPDGKPVYQGGVRGVVERNTMRYYLAIEAYLSAISLPAAEQSEKRLLDWHAGVERYPVQLHELDRAEYLEMKHKELARQKALSSAKN